MPAGSSYTKSKVGTSNQDPDRSEDTLEAYERLAELSKAKWRETRKQLEDAQTSSPPDIKKFLQASTDVTTHFEKLQEYEKLAAAKRCESHVSVERNQTADCTAELTSEIDRLTGTLRSLNRSMESNWPPLGPARYESRIDMITKELSARQRDLASIVQASNEKAAASEL
jgi:hypothetical protein